MTSKGTSDAELLSIGDLATATGISTDTIRVWERRYGKPEPVRLPSGHRRYRPAHVTWLRRVAEALANGYRPGTVVRAGQRELAQMLRSADDADDRRAILEPLFESIVAYDREALVDRLEKHAATLPLECFLDEVVAPLLTEVGRRWADGAFEIRHEHFATEVLEDVLRSIRTTALPEPDPEAPTVLFATLEGETHSLGLHMAALVATDLGRSIRILGPNCPVAEIVDAARETGATTVALSVSLSTGGVATDRVIAELRANLPKKVALVVGGRGARGVRRGPRGVLYAPTFGEFTEVLSTAG